MVNECSQKSYLSHHPDYFVHDALSFAWLTKAWAQGPPPNATVLVWESASIVGDLTIQFGKLAGLNVYATASKRHPEYLRCLGASLLFDYHTSTVVEDAVAAAERKGKPIAHVVDALTSSATLGSVHDILSRSTATVKKITQTTL
jgi:NADPH:quinone reductase-like Zn-dependent oxidoreductase